MAMEEDDQEPVAEGLRDGKSAEWFDESEQKSPSLVAAVVELPRKQRRKEMKKEKRKQKRKEAAEKARQEEEDRLNDPEEQRRIQLEEEREKERLEQERREFEEKERLFLEALARKKTQEQEEEDRRRELQEKEAECEANEDGEWEYVEEGPPEIIWQGNEIIVKKNKVKVKKKALDLQVVKEDPDRPTSNPLLPQSEAFADCRSMETPSAQQLLQNVAQQVPNFGTEQDKAHCPFHLKTGACRFGSRCSRVHFYPDRSCTLLIKNMYSGPGLAWQEDEGLEYSDEEAERSYEEFYEDVHTEFLRFGEIVNFKVCRNGSHHLRGNVYVHYASVDHAVCAFHAINGRYFAKKQVSCEFVSVTKWRVAICGEYMKSRLKTCSRGTACNFIHCFHNPGGDYEWADWDKPPPKYWVKKMTALFGYSLAYEKSYEPESPRHHENHSSGRLATNELRYRSQRSQSTERKSSNKSPGDHERKDESQRSKYRKRQRSDDVTRPDTYEREYEEEQYSTSRGHEKKRRQHDSKSDKDRSGRYHDDGDGYHDRRRRKTSRHLESPDSREKHHEYPKRRSIKEETDYSTEEISYDTDTSWEHSYDSRRSLSSKDNLHRERKIYGGDSTGYSTDEGTHDGHGQRRKSKTHRHGVSRRSKSSRKKEITKRDVKIETASHDVDETRKQRKKAHGKSRSHDWVDEHLEESRSRSRSRSRSSRKMDYDEQD